MKLYIANCSKGQTHMFVYRVVESDKLITQVIHAGSQTQISGDHSAAGIDYIVDQHRRYGLVCVDQIDRTKPYFGLAYSIDKPISADKLQRAIAHNDEALNELGRQLRQEAAVTVNVNAGQFSADHRLPGISSLEMSIIEDRSNGGSPGIAEGVRVTGRAGDQPTPPTRGRRRAA